MGASWVAVRDGARLHTLRKTDPDVAAVASRWDDLVQYLVLHLTRDLGRDVRQLLVRQENTASTRHQALKDALVSRGQLYAQLQIPHTAGPLEITVDLMARQITIATELEAPKDGKSRGRVGWLMRQMTKAPADTTIEARISRLSSTLAGSGRRASGGLDAPPSRCDQGDPRIPRESHARPRHEPHGRPRRLHRQRHRCSHALLPRHPPEPHRLAP